MEYTNDIPAKVQYKIACATKYYLLSWRCNDESTVSIEVMLCFWYSYEASPLPLGLTDSELPIDRLRRQSGCSDCTQVLYALTVPDLFQGTRSFLPWVPGRYSLLRVLAPLAMGLCPTRTSSIPIVLPIHQLHSRSNATAMPKVFNWPLSIWAGKCSVIPISLTGSVHCTQGLDTREPSLWIRSTHHFTSWLS